MSTSLENVTELLALHQAELEKDREKLRRELRDVEGELARVTSAMKSLRAKPERAGKTLNADVAREGTSKIRTGSVKALVIETLRATPLLTPAELTQLLFESGQLSEGKEGSVRTALWQLRKDDAITTDVNGRSQLASST
jgi:hypothetical protein